MRDASVGHQCPECVAEGRRTQRSARTAFGGSVAGRDGVVTKTLIGLNVIAALIGVALYGADTLLPNGGLFGQLTQWQLAGGVFGPSFGWNTNQGVVVYTGVYDGGYYRLVTAMFIHYGIIHLLFNMWALWTVGRPLEAALGRFRFAALYLLAGIGGNVAALLINPNATSAGASTAIFGLFAAFFVIARRLGGDTRQILVVLVINLVITFTLPGVSWAGHVGGLVTGALVAAILAYAPRDRRTVIQAVGCAIVLVALVGITLAKVASVTA
ncbi:rhomboid family intramembrane serine protease [Asanoa iriomotensis]|uniref:Rhomboid family intramembrane serine protease n=2 Tax=Asanoa iriomotensis TaxID=234613 RepID=A0ABQ4C8H5_9ACTN|nr:rhomboid family intramembrane serine protease [Asanoa iriomotensis]